MGRAPEVSRLFNSAHVLLVEPSTHCGRAPALREGFFVRRFRRNVIGAGHLTDSNNGSWRNTTRREVNGRAMRYNTLWHATREIRVKPAHRVDAAIRRLSGSEARA